jgi:amino acid adenylation domain-containing protein
MPEMKRQINKVLDILNSARQQGVDISVKESKLQLKVKGERKIDERLLQEVKENKTLIIEFLENEDWKAAYSESKTEQIKAYDRNIIKRVPLSYSQERLWIVDRLEGSVQYNIPIVLWLKGKIDLKALENCLNQIIHRHEVLRTVFREDDLGVYQFVEDKSLNSLSIIDGKQYKNDQVALDSLIDSLIEKPFNLSTDFMLRENIIQLSQDEFVLVVTIHHIATDAWSRPVIVKEVIELYSAFAEGREAILPKLPFQYSDYAIWQSEILNETTLNSKLDYWKNKLRDTAPLNLPTDFPRPTLKSIAGDIIGFTVEKELAAKIQNLSQKQGTSLYMTLLAAFKILLFKYARQNDISVGTSIANRPLKELDGLIGFFVNTITLRSEVTEDLTFEELLQQVKITTLGAYANKEVPFEKVVETVVKQRDPSRNPLFQVMLVLLNTPETPQLKLGDLEISKEGYKSKISKFELTFIMNNSANGMGLKVEYLTDLYKEETIRGMVKQFFQLLDSVTNNPKQKIRDLRILSRDEEQKILNQASKVTQPTEGNETLISLFEQQVLQTPNALAIQFQNQKITYQQLNEKANQLARLLQSKGVTAETLIPICLDRSHEMIVAILGVLKSGAAYVPIDINYPESRIKFILEDTKSKFIITRLDFFSKYKIAQVEMIDFITHVSEIEKQENSNPPKSANGNNLAYVIYTSGSTGQPKGVMVEHEQLLASTLARNNYYSSIGTAFLVPSFSFDSSVAILFWSLTTGGKLLICSDEDLRNSSGVKPLIEEANTLLCVPSYYRFLLDEGLTVKSALTKVILAGEKLEDDLAKRHFTKFKHVLLFNEYGPTENTVWASVAKLESNQIVSIGKPVSGVQIYITDDNGNLNPVGVPGEIRLGGHQVTRGYLNQPELTSQKYVPNNFSEILGARLYRTGDYARLLSDGNIEFIGRIDDQVKIRGFRIELGEIESILQKQPEIIQCVVLSKLDPQGSQRLVAYVVGSEWFNKEVVAERLKTSLPEYMIPPLWVELISFPLTPNGKIDRKALPDPKAEQISYDYEAPNDEMEHSLVEMWQDILEVEKVGIHDDFFVLGGHSLIAIRMISAIRKLYNIELPIGDIFDYPTIAKLKERISADNLLLPAINPQKRPENIPLSFSQERLWFIDKMEGSRPYHIPSVLRLSGELNVSALQQSIQQIVNRHEILRTIVKEINGQGYQQINAKDQWNLGQEDAGNLSETQLNQRIGDLVNKPFDLKNDLMLRADLLTIKTNEHILVVTIHHIASDGWSTSIMVKELVKLYEDYVNNQIPNFPLMGVQYADYALWQRNYLKGDALEKKLDYWRKKLQNAAPLELLTDFPRTGIPTNRGSVITVKTDKQLLHKLNLLGQANGTTLFMTTLAAFKLLLYRYTNQQDITVGTPMAGRQQKELESLIGFFINTLALRDEVNPNLSFTQLLQSVRTTALDAFKHQDVPFEKVVEAVAKDRQLKRSPVFQVLFSVQNIPEIPKLKLGNLELSRVGSGHSTAQYEITCNIRETEIGLNITIEYNTDLFSEDSMQRMLNYFVNLLQEVAVSPEQKIAQFSMVDKSEQNWILKELNKTQASYNYQKTLVEWFESQVDLTPNDLAVKFKEQILSFAQLNAQVNQLTYYLIEKGVKTGDLIPICTERGISMLIGLLAIMKAGAAYVPIDPDSPNARIKLIIEDTRADFVLTDSVNSSSISQAKVINVEYSNQFKTYSEVNPKLVPNPSDLVYVIYTSGSTGNPKGVMIEHRSLMDYVFGLLEEIPLSQSGSFALASSIATDLGNTVLFGSLFTGGLLHILDKNLISNAAGMHAYFEKNSIDCLKIVPSHWNALVWDSKPLLPRKLLIFGGESLRKEMLEPIRNWGKSCVIINHYGPTETTVGKLFHRVDLEQNYQGIVPIGNPFSNAKAYILSQQLALCPVGVPGELYLSGPGLARGYLNNATLTADKFIENPWVSNELLYKTGDLVKYLPSGEIAFIGRVDEQVKVRGYRIEPSEIESVILSSGLLKQAAVLAKEDQNGDKKLVAYLVKNELFDREKLDEILSQSLPEYMIPAQFVELDYLPLMPNGKLDKKLLPEVETLSNKRFVAPSDDMEHRIAAVWMQVLDLDSVGIFDDFFELGGHSLLAIRLISAIRSEFNAEIPIGDIFDFPTIEQLKTRIILKTGEDVLPAITHQIQTDRIPLSFSQERLWFIDQLEGSLPYHIPTVLKLDGKLNVLALELAFKQIIERHQILRSVIETVNGDAFQKVISTENWHLETYEDVEFTENPEALNQFIIDFQRKPFDLSKDYRMRCGLIKITSDQHVLLVTLHHIASDGWSTSILVRELSDLYKSYDLNIESGLENLEIQYSDFAIWQRKYLRGNVLESKLNYWKNKLENVSPLELFTDFQRPAIQGHHGAISKFNLDKSLLPKLKSLNQKEGATMFMTLLSVFKVLLFKYTDQNDICVGSPITGRNQKEVETLIGFFLNTLAIRSHPAAETSFKDFLEEIKITTLEAYENQEVPFEKVVEASVKERNRSRSPLFQVMFIYQNNPEIPAIKLGNLKLERKQVIHNTSRFDLTFNVLETEDGMRLSIEYNTDLFLKSTIDKMGEHFENLLKSVLENSKQKLSEISMLSKRDIEHLIFDLNETNKSFTPYTSIAQLFEEQVGKTPESVAISYGLEKLTYLQVNSYSNQLAHLLISKGIKPHSRVAISMDPGFDRIVGILAILKTGACYVPLDSEYPNERIQFILEEIDANLILCSNTVLDKFIDIPGLEILETQKLFEELGPYKNSNPYVDTGLNDEVYIMYTSGSTGKPKGVKMHNAALLNMLQWQQSQFDTHSRKVLQFASLNFDVSFQEIFSTLCFGAELRLITYEKRIHMQSLIHEMNNSGVSHLFVPYIVLKNFAEEALHSNLKSLREIITAGEQLKLTPEIEQLIKEKKIRLINQYGPTEAHVVCSYIVTENDHYLLPPIGKPINNTFLYVCDSWGNLLPKGLPGELFISGIQVSKGYIKNPELNKQRFIKDSFRAIDDLTVYKTGDLVRWNPEGNLEYLGRKDEQVKVRGFRVELGEIENTLQQSGLINEIAVISKPDPRGSNRLIGFFSSKNKIEKDELVSYLKARIPDYMIPQWWVHLDNLPINTNGKVDKKALPDTDFETQLLNKYVAPQTETQIQLVNLWQELMGLEKVGIHDNFFEIGGHSLLAMRLIAAINQQMPVELGIKIIFTYPSIFELAGYIDDQITIDVLSF